MRGPKILGLKGKSLTICVTQKINNAREVWKKVIYYLVLALFLYTFMACCVTQTFRKQKNVNQKKLP